MKSQDNAINSLAHTKWNCKYHIVFAPKYRRKVFYEGENRDKGDTENIMSVERCRDNRRRGMYGPYTSIGQHTAENECIRIYGIFEG